MARLTLAFAFAGKEGLKIMNRHHIHCASGMYGQEGVTSGKITSLFIPAA
jgi:RNA:NAD 2'-phosphotransferase (TPT1/KptA family)